ncbi:hypothetical protein BH11MYX4_BH11MYX4_66860 [soil metagenome]
MTRPRRLLFAAVPAALLVACQLVAGIERVDKEDAPALAPDAGAEAAPVPDPCAHVAPPPPPAKDDDPVLDNQLAPFYVATSEIHLFGKTDAGAVQGFDLDGVCTCDTRPGAAHGGASACLGPRTCDRDGGIDNGTLSLLDVFGAFLPPGTDLDTAASLNTRIAVGDETLLFVISNYNGRANDKEVTVGLVVSHGIQDGTGCGTDVGRPKPPYPPGWCGKDKWTVDPDGVIGAAPPYAPSLAATAYVTDHRLVIDNEKGSFQVPFGDVSLTMFSPIVVATIVPLDAAGNPRDPSAAPAGRTDGNFRLDDGVLAGRVPASSMLAVAGALRAPGSKDAGPDQQYLCQSGVFDVLKGSFCGERDIASSKQVDFDPKAICDAISATTTFQARPAVAGARYRPADFFNACIVSGNDAGALAEKYRCTAAAGDGGP